MSANGTERHSWEWARTPGRPEPCKACGRLLSDPVHYTDREEELLEAGAPLTSSEADFLIFKAARSLELAGLPRDLEAWEKLLRIVLELVDGTSKNGGRDV